SHCDSFCLGEKPLFVCGVCGTPVPGRLHKQSRHSAEARKPGQHQAGTHAGGDDVKTWMDEGAERHTQQSQTAGREMNLALKLNGLRSTTMHIEAGPLPGVQASLEDMNPGSVFTTQAGG